MQEEQPEKQLPEQELNEPPVVTESKPHESRMEQHLEKQTARNILLVVGGLIALGVILALFGTQLLIGFSLLLEKMRGGNENPTAVRNEKPVYVAPPTLNPVVDATNSATIVISGNAQRQQKIKLYLNNQFIDQTSVRGNNKFTFSDVTLQNGKNEIKVKAIAENDKESAFSKTEHISFLKEEPTLSIAKPQDGQGFNKDTSVSIEGQTDPGLQVTINDFVAIVDDQGKFTYLYHMKEGDNALKVVATDDAGNKKEQEIHIHTN